MANLVSKIKEYAKANGVTDIDFFNDVKVQSIDGIESIEEWNIDLTQPTEAQLDSYEDSANATESLVTTLNNRRNEYPDIGDQLDMIFRAGLGGDEFQASIQAIKDKYPKPSE